MTYEELSIEPFSPWKSIRNEQEFMMFVRAMEQEHEAELEKLQARVDAERERANRYCERLDFIAQLGRDGGFDCLMPEHLPGLMRMEIDRLRKELDEKQPGI